MTPDPVEHMLAQAAQRNQAEQQMMALLQRAMNAPAVIHRAGAASLLHVGHEGEERTLHVALLSGERWDIPLSEHQRRIILRELADPVEAPEPAA